MDWLSVFPMLVAGPQKVVHQGTLVSDEGSPEMFTDHRLVPYAHYTPWAMRSFDGRAKSLLRAAPHGAPPGSQSRKWTA